MTIYFRSISLFLCAIMFIGNSLASAETSMTVKDAYYLNGDYKGLRSALKRDQQVADIPSVSFGKEAKPVSPRNLVLILDELAEMHTYLDPNQEQVFALNRRIRNLLQGELVDVFPSYSSRYSYYSQISNASQLKMEADWNRIDLKLIGERVERREKFFRERLLAQSLATASTALAEMLALWDSSPTGLSARHRLELARRIIQIASVTGQNKGIVSIGSSVTALATDNTLSLRERIVAQLFAAYIETVADNPAKAVNLYRAVIGLIAKEVDAEQQKRKERFFRFNELREKQRDNLENKQILSFIGQSMLQIVTVVGVAKLGVLASTGDVKMFNAGMSGMSGGMNAYEIEISDKNNHNILQVWSISADTNPEITTLHILHRYVDIPLILELIPALIRSHAARNMHKEVLAIAEIYFIYADKIRGSTFDSRSREAFQARMGEVFRTASTAAFATNDAKTLLEISERFSSNILLDTIVTGRTRLDNSQKYDQQVAVTPTISLDKKAKSVGQRTVVVKTLTNLDHRINTGSFSSQGERDALTNFVALTNAKIMKPDEIIAYLGDKSLTMARLLETDDQIGILFASSDGFRLVSEKVSKKDVISLKKSVEQLMSSEKNGRAELFKVTNKNPASRFLSKHLFASNSPLLLIPSPGLADFPFSALLENDVKAPRYLIEQRPIIQHFSVSISKAIGSGVKRPKKLFASLGNPLLISEYANVASLPGAERESREAAALLGGVSLVKSDATQENLFTALQTYDIVHVATHGIFNAKDPLDSRLVIPSADGKSGGISALRLYGQDIKASTVFLSACSLGRNRITQGNEVNGFIRPLLMQSVKNIVTNLWEVDDEGAYTVTLSILGNIKKGNDMTHAFQEGIKKVIANKQFASPYYWAPFVMFTAK